MKMYKLKVSTGCQQFITWTWKMTGKVRESTPPVSHHPNVVSDRTIQFTFYFSQTEKKLCYCFSYWFYVVDTLRPNHQNYFFQFSFVFERIAEPGCFCLMRYAVHSFLTKSVLFTAIWSSVRRPILEAFFCKAVVENIALTSWNNLQCKQ